MAELAVEHINRLRPKFAIVCGDLVHAQPSGRGGRGPGGVGRNGYDPKAQGAQVAAFKRTMSAIDSSIALVCLCGNHDLGNLPNKATVDLFTSRFGSDYFGFWAGGCRCIVLNSSLHATNLWSQIAVQAEGNDGSSTDVLNSDGVPHTAETVAADLAEAAAMADVQEAWLDRELAALAEAEPVHSIVFTHIPPFCDDEQEAAAYHCYPRDVRARTLSKLKKAGISKWFSGHYHRNAGGWSDDLEVIVSGACGVMGPVVVDGRPRPLPGGQRSSNLPGGTLGAAVSGLRLVCVTRGAIGHRWFTHGAVPEQLDVAASAHKWPREGRPELRRARRAGRRPEAKL